MTPDLSNGLLEFVGSALIWMSVRQTMRDEGYAGLYIPATVFFAAWGLWNLLYYPHLGQWWSFAGGVSIVTANVVWVVCLLYYGPIVSPEIPKLFNADGTEVIHE